MFKSVLGAGAACAFLLLAGCQPLLPEAARPSTPDPAHSSQNALDWAGRYEGVLPCASCMGLKTELTLEKGGTYRMSETYLGKSKPFHSKGTFVWDAAGGSVILQGEQQNRRFKVGEGRLWQLDTEGHMIDGPLAGHMILTKR